MNILLADTPPSIFTQIEPVLKKEGYQLTLTQSHNEILKVVKTLFPCLILIKSNVPNINAFELCEDLKQHPSTQKIPVIFIYANPSVEEKHKGYEVGGVDYLCEPLDVLELIAKTKVHLKTACHDNKEETENILNHPKDGDNELPTEQHLLPTGSEKKFETLFESSPDGILISNVKNKKFDFVNSAAAHMFGYEMSEMRTLSSFDIHPEEDLNNAMVALEAAIQGDKRTVEGCSCLRKDGTVFYADITPALFSANNETYMVGFFRDITAREENLKQISTQNILMNSIINSPIDITIFSLDPQYCYTAFNNSHFQEMKLTYGVEIRKGMNLLEAVSLPEIKVAIKKTLDKVLSGESIHDVQFQENTGKYYEFNWQPIRNAENEILGVSAFIRDITRQKKQENEILEANRRFESLFRNMPSGFGEFEIILNDEGVPYDYRYLTTNPSFKKITGLQDVVGKTVRGLNVSPNLEMIKQFGKVALTGESVVFEQFSVALNKYLRIHAFSNAYGKFATLFDDITKEKEQEKEILLTNETLSQAIKGGDLGTFDLNLSTNSITLNNECFEMVGISADLKKEKIFETWFSNIHPEDQPEIQAEIARVRTLSQKPTLSEQVSTSFECRYIHPKKGLIWLLVSGKVIKRKIDNSAHQVGIIMNITERKKQEEDFKQANQLSNIALGLSNSASWFIDFSSCPDCLCGSQKLLEILGEKQTAKGNCIPVSQWMDNILMTNEELGNIAIRLFNNLHEKASNEYDTIWQYTRPIDKKVIWIRSRAEVLRDRNGELLKLYGVCQDITEQKLSEKKLIESAEQLEKQKSFIQSLMYAIPDIIFAKDLNGRYIIGNIPFGELVNTPPDQISGKTDYDLFSDNEAKLFTELDKKITSGSEQTVSEQWVTYPSGKVALLETIKVPFSDRQGKLLGIVGISRDITEKHKAKVDLETAKEAAEAANIAKSTFLANMSHEIRTPMNSIIGFTEVLNRKIKDNDLLTYLHSIQSSGKSLLHLINDILDLSKIEAGKMELNYEFFDICQVVSEVESLFKTRASEKGLNFKASIASDVPKIIKFDELRMRQVMINLIGNAIKFTNKGFVSLTIETNKKKDSTVNLTLKVTDSGIGISEEKKRDIFGDFTQSDASISRSFGGTGLGLSISSKIIELFKGNIYVESTLHQGSTFTVEFPDILFSTENCIVDKSVGIDPDSISFSPARILIVDDIQANRNLLEDHLKSFGHTVYTAENGLEGVEKAKKYLPDLIFMDIRMPIMNGHEATIELSKDSKTQIIPVIACTASALKDSDQEIQNSGFKGCLHKPVLINKITQELCRFIKWTQKEKTEDKKEVDIQIDETVLFNVKTDILPILEKLNQARSISIQKKLAEKLIANGEKYKNETILTLGKSLKEAIKLFNIEHINDLMTKIRTIFEDKQ